jgi:cyanate lyase
MMNRIEVTEKIIATKVGRGLKWFKVMDDGRLSWPDDADPGTGRNRQGDFLVERGRAAMADRRALQGNVGRCQTGRSVDLPVYELISVYETTLKELIHEEFDDGIMSAIGFRTDFCREPDPHGDRVNMTLFGKFLP